MDPRPPRTSPAPARRAPGSVFPGRTARRTRRTTLRSSAHSLNEGAYSRVVLHARRGLEARARVHGPRVTGGYRLGHVLGPQAAGEHEPPLDGEGAVDVRRVLS